MSVDNILRQLPCGISSSNSKPETEMSGKLWVTEPNGYLEPKIGATGFAATPAKTIVEIFQQCVAQHGDKKALFLKRAVNVSVLSASNVNCAKKPL